MKLVVVYDIALLSLNLDHQKIQMAVEDFTKLKSKSLLNQHEITINQPTSNWGRATLLGTRRSHFAGNLRRHKFTAFHGQHRNSHPRTPPKPRIRCYLIGNSPHFNTFHGQHGYT